MVHDGDTGYVLLPSPRSEDLGHIRGAAEAARGGMEGGVFL